jgi:hypothetical protein
MHTGCRTVRVGRRQLDRRRCGAEFRKQYRRYCRAIQDGHGNKIHQLENLLLRSHSGKVLAVANAAREKKYQLDAAKLDVMASTLSCWERPPGAATFYCKKKSDSGLRGIFSYRIMQAAQQYLVWWVLAPRLRLHHGQYAVAGRDRSPAPRRRRRSAGAPGAGRRTRCARPSSETRCGCSTGRASRAA